MIWREFILSDEFSQYRKEMIAAIAKHVDRQLFDGDLAELKGALKMAQIIIRFPAQMVNSESPEVNETLKTALANDFKGLTARLVREAILK